MKTNRLFYAVIPFLLLVLPVSDITAQPVKKSIQPGDIPPPLYIQSWLKGEPVTQFEKGKIYALNFTGTWCPPCRKFLPKLTKIAEKYAGDVNVISLFFEENDEKKPTDLRYVEKVRKIMEAMGDQWGFSVAVDVPQQTSYNTWLKRLSGMPIGPSTTFVIDGSGRIAWIGKTYDLDPILAQVIAGNDPTNTGKLLKEEHEGVQAALKRIFAGKETGQYKKAFYSMDSLIKKHPGDLYLYFQKFELLAGADDDKAYAWIQWMMANEKGYDWPHFVSNTYRYPKKVNYDIVLKAYDHTIAQEPTVWNGAYLLADKAQVYIMMKEYAKAIQTYRQAMEYMKMHPSINADYLAKMEDQLKLYQYLGMAEKNVAEANAWLQTLFNDRKTTMDTRWVDAVINTGRPDYALAQRILDRIVDERAGKEIPYYILSRQAAIHAGKGDYTKAIAVCEQAIAAVKYEQVRETLKARLAEYKQKLKDAQ